MERAAQCFGHASCFFKHTFFREVRHGTIYLYIFCVTANPANHNQGQSASPLLFYRRGSSIYCVLHYYTSTGKRSFLWPTIMADESSTLRREYDLYFVETLPISLQIRGRFDRTYSLHYVGNIVAQLACEQEHLSYPSCHWLMHIHHNSYLIFLLDICRAAAAYLQHISRTKNDSSIFLSDGHTKHYYYIGTYIFFDKLLC